VLWTSFQQPNKEDLEENGDEQDGDVSLAEVQRPGAAAGQRRWDMSLQRTYV